MKYLKNKNIQDKNETRNTRIVFTDACARGYRGYVVEKLGQKSRKENFDELEISTSSTNRELLAIKYVLQYFNKFLKGETVEWFSDSSNPCRIINTKGHLQYLAVEIYNICIVNKYNTSPDMAPTKGKQNRRHHIKILRHGRLVNQQ